MAELNPDGLLVEVGGGVTIRSPGLRGRAEVHLPVGGGMRAAEETTDDFLVSLRNNGVEEQLTVAIGDHGELGGTGTGSRAAGGDNDIELHVPAPGTGWGQVLLYEAEDGSLSWHFPVGIPAAQVPTRGDETFLYRVPRAVVPAENPANQRGLLGAIGGKLLKVLIFKVADPVLGRIGNFFAHRFEQSHRPYRLRSFTPENYRTPSETPPDWALLARGQALLFVHGTASRAHSGFHGIPEPVMTALHERYGGRVFAFDHHTISATPDDNIAWLAEHLPPGMATLDLDVIAHSRGGLVARVLTEQSAATGLGGRIRVRNLVMVATPNAGTALADRDRLDHLLNRMTSLLQLVPGNGVTDVLDLVLAVVKQVAIGVFGGLDGIMAMNPGGSWLQQFNETGAGTAKYFAVAADYDPPQGSSLLRIARDGVTDVVFGDHANDLVVPTAGVHTVPDAQCFPIENPLLFKPDAAVDHSSYWKEPDFAEALKTWLPG